MALGMRQFSHFDRKEIISMIDAYKQQDALREQVIAFSREVLKESKQLVYELHRYAKEGKKPDKRVHEHLQALATDIKKLGKLALDHDPQTGIAEAAFEEYAEAACYADYLSGKKLRTAKQLGIPSDSYLGGLSDLTGELARYIVIISVRKDAQNLKEVERAKDLIEEVLGLMLQFDFRNGELRKKSDAVKWNLKKAEEVLFDLHKAR